jgi:hypothetical protein
MPTSTARSHVDPQQQGKRRVVERGVARLEDKRSLGCGASRSSSPPGLDRASATIRRASLSQAPRWSLTKATGTFERRASSSTRAMASLRVAREASSRSPSSWPKSWKRSTTSQDVPHAPVVPRPIWFVTRGVGELPPVVDERIADPWGARTPYPRSGDWPVRVDEHVEGAVERWVQSACALCSHGCALDIGVRGDRIVGVRGRAVDRVNHGRLGPKGLYGWQANNALDRLTRPLVRQGPELREATWEEAMNLVVDRTRDIHGRKGGGALGFYTSGQLFLEDYYTLALVARAGLGRTTSTGTRASARRRPASR